MTQEVSFSKVMREYRSLKAWAARLEVPYTTVIGWRDAGRIPKWRIDRVLDVANSDGKDILASASKRKRAA